VLIKNLASRWAMLCLIVSGMACAATPAIFAALNGSPSIIWTTTLLDKGDVVEVHAFKAPPGMIVFLGLCAGERCDDAHAVTHLPVYSAATISVTTRYRLEQGGHLMMWAVQPPRPELDAGGSKALSDDSRNQVAGVVHSGFSGIYTDASVLRMHKLEVAPDHAKARFDAGCFVTLSRVGATSSAGE
jgi:hypothetical protein